MTKRRAKYRDVVAEPILEVRCPHGVVGWVTAGLPEPTGAPPARRKVPLRWRTDSLSLRSSENGTFLEVGTTLFSVTCPKGQSLPIDPARLHRAAAKNAENFPKTRPIHFEHSADR